MGRIRSLKPEFFKHSGLFDAEQETGLPLRVAYAGLWTCCDREGRFKWRPRDLKLDVLPYDECDFSRVLDALATRGFIVQYRAGSEIFGFIPSWKAHQFINNKEPQSQIPEPLIPQQLDACATRESRVNDASSTRGVKEGRGGEGNDASLTREDDSISPEMIAQAVISELRISGRYLPSTITDVAKGELKAGRAATEIREAMIASRQYYDKSAGKLWKPIDVERFFGEGSWRNPDSWPWKSDQKPKAAPAASGSPASAAEEQAAEYRRRQKSSQEAAIG